MPHQCTSCGRTFEDGSKEMLSGCPDCGGNKFQFMPAGAVNGGGTAATGQKKTPEGTSTAGEHGGSARETAGGSGRETGVGSGPETGGEDSSSTSAVNRAAATVRDWVRTSDDSTDSSRTESAPTGSSRTEAGRDSTASAGTEPAEGVQTASVEESDGSSKPFPETEDSAQASARRDVVSKSELPDDPPQLDRTAGLVADSAGEENVVDAPADENPGLKELREELNSQFESIRIVEPGQYELNLMELYEREEYIIALQEDGKYVIEVPDAWDVPSS